MLGSISISSEYRRGVELVYRPKVVGAIEDGTAIDVKVSKATRNGVESTRSLSFRLVSFPALSQRVVY